VCRRVGDGLARLNSEDDVILNVISNLAENIGSLSNCGNVSTSNPAEYIDSLSDCCENVSSLAANMDSPCDS
jgi:hypothetical protein